MMNSRDENQRLMVIYYGTIRKKSPKKQIQVK